MRVACFLFPHFVVQVEARDNDSLKGKPIIVGGLPYERKIVYDASQETLSCGIRQGMPLREAYALCPQGVFLPLDEGKYATVFTAILTSKFVAWAASRVARPGKVIVIVVGTIQWQ